MALGLHMERPGTLPSTPCAATQFRSPTVSPRANRPGMDMTPPHVAHSPQLTGPSRRSHLAFPSYEPVHIGSAPNKVLSYSGPPPPTRSATGNSHLADISTHSPRQGGEPTRHPSTHSPRMTTQQQMQRQVGGSAQSLQQPLQGLAPARYSVTPTTHGGDEVVFFPSFTPRPESRHVPREGSQPVLEQRGGPRRTTGGSCYSNRQFGTNVSPRNGHRDLKLSIGGDPSHYSYGDKENRENIVMEYSNKDDRENLLLKLREENAVCSAKIAEQSVKLAENQQALDQFKETQAVHEQLRQRLREITTEKAAQEATEEQLQKEIQQLEEDNRLNLSELRKQENRAHLDKEDHKDLQERCMNLEAQNTDLVQRLRHFERHQADTERSRHAAEEEKLTERSNKDAVTMGLELALGEKDARALEMENLMGDMEQAMGDKDARILELERHMRDKDHHLGMTHHEKECLIHDKDQSLQELKHEYSEFASNSRKREAAWQAQLQDGQLQLQDLQTKLSLAESSRHASSKQVDEKDTRALRQQLQEKKTIIERLEIQLRRTSSMQGLISPGEYTRLAKVEEAKNGFAQENDRLHHRNRDLETESKLIRKEISLLRRRIPTEVCDSIAAEAVAHVAYADDEGNDSARLSNSRSRSSHGSQASAIIG